MRDTQLSYDVTHTNASAPLQKRSTRSLNLLIGNLRASHTPMVTAVSISIQTPPT